MKQSIKWASLALGVICSCFTCIYASQDSALVASFAQGFAITAKATGLESMMKNPAGMRFNGVKKVMLNLNETYGNDVLHGYFATAYRINDRDYIGLALPVVHVCNLSKTTVVEGAPVIEETFNAIQAEPRLTWTRLLSKKITLGVSGIALMDSIDTVRSTGFSTDVGIQYALNKLSLGVGIQDLLWSKTWSTNRVETKQSTLHLGVLLRPKDKYEILSDVSIIGKDKQVNLGANIMITESVATYLGIRNIGKQPHYRTGVGLDLTGMSVRYAYGRHPYLADSHKVSLVFRY